MIKATKEQVREGFVQQFRFIFGLEIEDAEEAADRLVADEKVVEAAIFCAQKSTEVAEAFGWVMPDELKEKKPTERNPKP